MSAADDALAVLSGEAPAVPVAATPAPAAPQSDADRALRVLDMTPDQLKDASMRPATGGFGQRLGSFATGANDVIAATLGAPFDFSAWLGNLGARGINALTGTETVRPVTRPLLGGENVRAGLSGVVGRTEPQDELDRLLYGAGAGVGSAATGMGVGGALQAAGRAPALANMLLGGGERGLLSAAGNLATGAGGGIGSVGGQDAIAALGGGEVAQALGSTAGGLLGGFATGLAPPLAVNAYRAGRAAYQPFTETGQKGIAGRVLKESATYGEPDIPATMPLDIKPTFGQVSNDPGLLALERTVQQTSPAIQGEMAARASENNQLIRGGMGLLGQPADRAPYQISQAAATGLEANRSDAFNRSRSAFEAVDPDRSVMIPMQPIRERMQNYIGDLTMARERMVPDDIVDLVMRSGTTPYNYKPPAELAMREVQDIRSSITGRERLARRAGDYNLANVLRNMDETIFQRLPEGAVPLPPNADQAATFRYQTALDEYRNYNETFNRKPISDVFKVEGTPDSAVLDKMLAPGQGQAERVGQYVRATMGDPTLGQHGRDWFTARMSNAIASARQDAQGEPFILGKKLGDFVTANRPLIDSPLFTAEQRQVIDSMVDAATMVERTGRAGATGGSDTAAKLAGKDYVSAMVGSWFKPVAAAEVVGAATGAGLMGGPGGAAAGVLAANRAATPVVERAYSGAADKVMKLLSEAMLDPAFAKELMRNATPGNTQFASPKLQNFLTTAPMSIELANPGSSRQ